MPAPKDGEKKKDFIPRCISYVMKNENPKSRDHAYTKCKGIYEQHRKKNKGS